MVRNNRLIHKKNSQQRLRNLFVESLETRRVFNVDISAAAADLNDDGRVNALDIGFLNRARGLVGVDNKPQQAGLQGYLEGLDFDYDGTDIGNDEASKINAHWGKRGISTGPTSVIGRVFDNFGNPLAGVNVSLDGTSRSDVSDDSGNYMLTVGLGETGFRNITFDGSEAIDPTPGKGSGQFPTIPHKPIFINGGIQTRFRDLSLPERDLHGSVLLDSSNSTPEGNGFRLTQEVIVDNAGVSIKIPSGSLVKFPPGEDPRLSITRVDPARVPIPMPAILSSSLFITYQPGGTVIEGNGSIVTEFDNTDLYQFDASNPANNNLEPGLAGVTDGVFAKVGTTTIIDADNDGFDPVGNASGDPDDILRATVPLPFEFAWYHVDILQPLAARTVVTGVVKDFVTNLPIANAWASIPGVGPVPTDALGRFSIFNVPAAPNGPRGVPGSPSFSPFNIRASASKDSNNNGLEVGEVGDSIVVPAVPGGFTDVGCIFLNVPGGQVNGKITKLTSISPFIEEPVSDTTVRLFQDDLPFQTIQTSLAGTYNFDAAFGNYDVFPFLNGSFEDSNPNDLRIDPPGDLDVHDFTVVGRGSVTVEVVDRFGDTVQGASVNGFKFEQELGAGYTSPEGYCNGFTDDQGIAFCDGEGEGYGGEGFGVAGFGGGGGTTSFPLGDFQVSASDFFGSQGVGFGTINFEGQAVHILIVLQPPADVASVDVQDVTVGGVSNIQTTVVLAGPFLGTFTDIGVLIEMDFIPGQGSISVIDQVNPPSGPTGLNGLIDARARCFFSGFTSFGNCGLFNAEGVSMGSVSASVQGINELQILIPHSSLGVGSGQLIRFAVLSNQPVFNAFDESYDVVPGTLDPDSGGEPISFTIGGTPVEFIDAQFDTFFNFGQASAFSGPIGPEKGNGGFGFGSGLGLGSGLSFRQLGDQEDDFDSLVSLIALDRQTAPQRRLEIEPRTPRADADRDEENDSKLTTDLSIAFKGL